MVNRRFKEKAAAATRLSAATPSTPAIQKQSLARGKRGKRQAARLRTRAWVATEVAKRAPSAAAAAGTARARPLNRLGVDLSAALAEASDLADGADAKAKAGPRGWRATAAAERDRLAAVLAAPRFVDGGLDALRDHLASAVSPDAAVVPDAVAKRKRAAKPAPAGAPGSSAGSRGRSEEARERVAKRRELKVEAAAEAVRRAAGKKKKKGGSGGGKKGSEEEIRPQKLSDLLGGQRRRGRIGEKREKML